MRHYILWPCQSDLPKHQGQIWNFLIGFLRWGFRCAEGGLDFLDQNVYRVVANKTQDQMVITNNGNTYIFSSRNYQYSILWKHGIV